MAEDHRPVRNNIPEVPYQWRARTYPWAQPALAAAEAEYGQPEWRGGIMNVLSLFSGVGGASTSAVRARRVSTIVGQVDDRSLARVNAGEALAGGCLRHDRRANLRRMVGTTEPLTVAADPCQPVSSASTSRRLPAVS